MNSTQKKPCGYQLLPSVSFLKHKLKEEAQHFLSVYVCLEYYQKIDRCLGIPAIPQIEERFMSRNYKSLLQCDHSLIMLQH